MKRMEIICFILLKENYVVNINVYTFGIMGSSTCFFLLYIEKAVL